MHWVLNKNLGMLMRQFHLVKFDIKLKLFESFCKPLYGSDIWLYRKDVKTSLMQLAISYHIGLKNCMDIHDTLVITMFVSS